MVRYCYYCFFAIICGLFSSSIDISFGQAKEDNASTIDDPMKVDQKNPIQLRTEVALESVPLSWENAFRGSVVLEPQEVGETLTIQLDIKNTTENVLKFARATTSCSCISFKVSATEFPPGAIVPAVLKVKVENGNEEGANNYPVQFEDSAGNNIGYITCVVPAKNRLFVGESSYGILDIAEGIVEYKVPIIYSDPIRFENLSVVLAEDAFERAEVTTTLEKNGKHKAMLVLRLHSESLTDAVSAGTIQVVDAVSSKTASKTFFLRKQLPVEVLPTELQFIEIQDSDGMRATAIVRALPQKKVEDSQEESGKTDTDSEKASPKLSITLNSDNGTPLPAKVVQLGSGLARVTIEISSEESKRLKRIDWQVTVRNVSYQCETKVNVGE